MTTSDMMMNLVSRLTNLRCGMKVEELVKHVYDALTEDGYDCYIINDRYLCCEGHNFQFTKDKKFGYWKVREY